jgi:hypothetical protein
MKRNAKLGQKIIRRCETMIALSGGNIMKQAYEFLAK